MYGSHEAAIIAFEDALARHPDDRRFFPLYLKLVVLYAQVENEPSANAVIGRFKSVMRPDTEDYRTLGNMLEVLGRYEEILAVYNIPWRQIFDPANGEASLAQQYGITGLPAPWLIDREGKLITHDAREPNLEIFVAKAVKD